MKRNLQNSILELRQNGLSYRQIAKQLNCSRGTVSYYLTKDLKQKSKKRAMEYKKNNPISTKATSFNRVSKKSTYFNRKNKNRKAEKNFTGKDVVEKFGKITKCYLTGIDVDLNNSNDYEFDHIIPISKGGDNSINNLGILSKKVNRAKNDLTVDEFIQLCRDVVDYVDKNGYRASPV